jgi:hypothetical protein
MSPVLARVDVGGAATAWRAAGFHVDGDGSFRAGAVVVRAGAGEDGIADWVLADSPLPRDVGAPPHPNGTTSLDHLVVFTDDPARTAGSYAARGLEARRVRAAGSGTTQTFFRTGEAVIELVGPVPGVTGERAWGLAFTVADLDACAALLGDALGPVKDAVQRGRRIATLRHTSVGLAVPVAFMSP